jgi:hypothetical protein
MVPVLLMQPLAVGGDLELHILAPAGFGFAPADVLSQARLAWVLEALSHTSPSVVARKLWRMD